MYILTNIVQVRGGGEQHIYKNKNSYTYSQIITFNYTKQDFKSPFQSDQEEGKILSCYILSFRNNMVDRTWTQEIVRTWIKYFRHWEVVDHHKVS